MVYRLLFFRKEYCKEKGLKMNLNQLIKSDFKNIYRDPTLLMASVAPFLLLFVVLIGLPLITSYVELRWGVDLVPFHRMIKLFFILLVSMIYGMISAFIILEDIDESIISFIKITPFSMKGYLIYRIGFTFLSSLFGTAILTFPLFINHSLSLFDSIFLILLVPLEAIFMAIFIVAFANNKVEGLALSKIVGLIPFSAIGAFLIPGGMKYVLAVFPPFWLILTIEANNVMSIFAYTIITFLIHLFFIAIFMKKFNHRIN